MSDSMVLRGIVHGKTIEIDRELGLPDGQAVTIVVQPTAGGAQLPPGEGLRRAFGTWADDAEELENFLEWNRQQRKIGRREIDS